MCAGTVKGRAGQGGLSLVEVAIVVAVLGIFLGAGLKVLRPQVEAANRDRVETQLETIADALALYAARTGRLPCPSDATARDGSDSFANDGRAQPADATDCAAGTRISGVPWRDLGLAQETVIDPWGRQIAYRVYDGMDGLTRTQGDFPASLGMTAQHCGCPGPDCTGGASSQTALRDCDPADRTDHIDDWLRSKGLTVQGPGGNPMIAPDPPSCDDGSATCGGAALVLISYGPNGSGAYTGAGARMALPGGANEQVNTTFDGTFMSALGLSPPDNVYDDFVLARSIDAITAKAGLRP